MTMPISDFNKISPTALLVAYARQFSDIPYTKEIAKLTNAEATVNQFVSQTEEQPIGIAALIEARYKAIEQVRTRFDATQILELASGLLPRGTILSQDPAIAFIESDLSEMIRQKQQLVQQLIGKRSNLHFLEIDATSDLNPRTVSDYFQPNKPVTILCEGLLMYLTFAEKQRVFANVRNILQTYGGVWITADLTTKLRAEKLEERDSALQLVRQKIVNSTGRSFAENEFDDLEHVKQFVQEQGFQAEQFSVLEVLDQLKCVSALGIDLDRTRSMLATSIFALTLA